MSNGFDPELLKFVQSKVEDRCKALFEAQAGVPQDDYTIVAMGTFVLNRLMLHLMNVEGQLAAEAEANARAEAIISSVEQEKRVLPFVPRSIQGEAR